MSRNVLLTGASVCLHSQAERGVRPGNACFRQIVLKQSYLGKSYFGNPAKDLSFHGLVFHFLLHLRVLQCAL